MKHLAPIAFFAYNRYEHTVKTIQALSRNAESARTTLYLFIDGPKSEKDQKEIKKISDFVTQINNFKEIILEKSPVNLGLSKSIIRGISKVLQYDEKIIVVEDDILVSESFLDFMNAGLDMYQEDLSVASIHGYVFPTKFALPETFFLQGADCWGWATWKRAWNTFNSDGGELLSKINNHSDRNLFDFNGFGGYIKMLEDNVQKRNDSWAIRWYASTFIEDMYTLYPGRSIVNNIGMDGSGTHNGRFARIFKQNKFQNVDYKITIEKIPVQDSKIAREAFTEYFKLTNSNFLSRTVERIMLIIKRALKVQSINKKRLNH